jgi:hypothetical protein
LDLLLDLLLEFGLHTLNCLDALFCILLQLLSLSVKAFLIVLFLLNVLALNDLLGLLSNSVQLHILSTFFKVSDLQFESFVFILYLFKQSLVLQNVNHLLNLRFAFSLYLIILPRDSTSQNQNGILVVSCNRRLSNFDLALFQIYDHFEVVLQLLYSNQGLAFFVGDNL